MRRTNAGTVASQVRHGYGRRVEVRPPCVRDASWRAAYTTSRPQLTTLSRAPHAGFRSDRSGRSFRSELPGRNCAGTGGPPIRRSRPARPRRCWRYHARSWSASSCAEKVRSRKVVSRRRLRLAEVLLYREIDRTRRLERGSGPGCRSPGARPVLTLGGSAAVLDVACKPVSNTAARLHTRPLTANTGCRRCG